MKLPNKYGSVTKLSGSRRKPWMVRIYAGTKINYETMKAYPKQVVLGYYASRKEAMQALADYNSNPYNIDRNTVTIGELWDQIKEKVDVSDERRKTYMRTFHKYIEYSIASERIMDVKTGRLQELFDSCEYGHSTQANIRSVLNHIYTYALQNDIIQQNYLEYIKIENEETTIERQLYTPEEISALWENSDKPEYALALILLYEGTRIKEIRELPKENVDLKERTISITEAKNEQSKRIIPIHDKVFPLVETAMRSRGDRLFEYTARQYAYFTENVLGHRSYDTRHTFASEGNKVGIPKLTLQRIMGHKPDSILEQAYIHLTIEDLRKEMHKITFGMDEGRMRDGSEM